MNILQKIKKRQSRKRFIKYYGMTPEEYLGHLKTLRNADRFISFMESINHCLQAYIKQINKNKNGGN